MSALSANATLKSERKKGETMTRGALRDNDPICIEIRESIYDLICTHKSFNPRIAVYLSTVDRRAPYASASPFRSASRNARKIRKNSRPRLKRFHERRSECCRTSRSQRHTESTRKRKRPRFLSGAVCERAERVRADVTSSCLVNKARSFDGATPPPAYRRRFTSSARELALRARARSRTRAVLSVKYTRQLATTKPGYGV